VNLHLRLALRYLAGRRQRTILTTLAIVLGVMIIFGFGGLLPVFENSFRQNLAASAGHVDLTVTSEARGVFEASTVDRTRSVPGVASVTGALVRAVVLPAAEAPETTDGKPVNTLLVSGVDPATGVMVRTLLVTSGRGLAPDDGNVVLISEALSARTGLGLGATLRLPSASGATSFEVVGLVATPPLPGVEPIYVPLTTAQELFNLPGQVNTIEAIFASGANAAEVSQAVLAELGPGYKLGGNEVGAEFMNAMKMGKIAFNFIGALALIMGGFVIFNTFRTVVYERRRDIGMLRSIGASRRAILGLVFAESLLQGIIGTALGLVAGFLMAAGLLAALGPLAERFWHFPLGGPIFSPGTYTAAIVLGLGVTIVGGIGPALAASRVTPLEALRPSVGHVTWKATRLRLAAGVGLLILALTGLVSGRLGLSSLGAVLFLVALAVIGPVLVQPISSVFGRVLSLFFAREGRVAQGNLVRHPGRAAITVSTVMISLAILVAFAGMGASLISGVVSFMDRSLGQADYLLMPESLVLGGGNVGAGPGLVQAVRDLPGVTEATTLRLATARTAPGEGVAADLQVVGIDPVAYPRLSGLTFSSGDPAEAFAALGAGRAVILNSMFALQTGIKAGQDLTLLTPDGPRTYRVAGVGSDFLNAKFSTAYISQANLERDFRETSDLLVMIRRAPDADTTALRAGLEGAVSGYPAFSVFAVTEWRDSMLAYMSGAMSFIYVLMIVLAVPSLLALVNTLGINVLERTRELGVLRAVGATRRQVRRIIVAESLLLSCAGAVFGILGGVWLGYVMVGGMSAAGWPVPYFFPYLGILLAVVAALLIGVVGALVPARQAARLNVVEALQYE